MEKLGQIAHLDQNPSSSLEDNLAFMCLEHHSLFDSKTSQHKNYTIQEVKSARSNLYKLVSEGRHLTPVAAVSYSRFETDRKILQELLEVLPSHGVISFLRHHDFGGPYRTTSIEAIRQFVNNFDGPDHEFLDEQIESLRKDLHSSCTDFLHALAHRTFRVEFADGFLSIPSDWKTDKTELWERARAEINTAADELCKSYDDLVRTARRKLAT